MEALMNEFEYTSHPAHVVFGSGSLAKLPAELARLNVSLPLLLSGPRQASQVAGFNDDILDSKAAGIYSSAAMHTPTSVTAEAMEVLQGLNPKADSIVSIGGGSAIGLGKALALRTGLPHIAVPTTYAGSEMTHHLGETENGRKVTKKDPRIVPQTVIYDAQLTLSLPVETSVLSGMNAIAHASKCR
jgi:alcohol dehydrogenase class IV